MDLKGALEVLPQMLSADGKLFIPKDHYYPGFWVLLAAYANSHKLEDGCISFGCTDVEGYSSAIGLRKALYNVDDYVYHRRNEGKSFSGLVHLRSSDQVDDATSTINSCLSYFTQSSTVQGVRDLKHVVGELHDNVWAHGLASGFSMAQRSKVPYSKEDHHIEFAIADSGLGFLEEMNRVGFVYASNDQEAIEWCVREGNTTKRVVEDPWAQALPTDAISSPMPTSTIVGGGNRNHHQGLGLAKLMKLCESYSGDLCVASGNALLNMANGETSFHTLSTPWKGVAISCRLKQSKLATVRMDSGMSPELQDIIRKLGGAL